MRATDLLPILDRFLEAIARTRRERALAKATQRAESALSRAFQEQGRVFVELWDTAAREAGLREGPPPPPPPPPPPGDAALTLPWEQYFGEAELQTLQLFEEPIQALAETAIQAGARATIADLGADISFNLANPRAVAFLERYGAERVTKINQTTRKAIHDMVTRGMELGLPYDQVAEEISSRFSEFAVGMPQRHIESRAHLVAVTEAANGYEEGSRSAVGELEEAGIEIEHKWLTVGDSRVSDGCRSNQAAGWIPNGQAFPSGHDRPPRFPGCRCTALYQRQRSEPKRPDVPVKQAAFDLSNYPDRPPVRSMFSGKTVPGSRDGIDEAINAINEVHRLPVDVADVEVVAAPWFDAGSGTMGAFNPTSMGSARPSIFLRDDIAASMKSETLVHEFGHYIDYEVLGEAASSGMNGTGVLKEVMQAIKDSTSYRDFLDIQRAGHVMVEAVDGTVTKAVLEPEFIEYVLKPDELWARAYAQYIGTHSSNPLINEAIADLTYSEKNRFLPYQWKADDFAAIDREITKAMEALGWLLK